MMGLSEKEKNARILAGSSGEEPEALNIRKWHNIDITGYSWVN
jgi:hypothetical protein